MFGNPLGFLALLALPAIVALHFFRRRFRPHVVSALFLWSNEDRTPLSGRKREKLRQSVSLWAECLAALCLALLLAGPRGCDGGGGRHLVVVLDASASMNARAPSGDALRERALAKVEERVRALPRGSRVTLVASGLHPRLLAGPAALPEESVAALATFEPTALHHDLSPSVALALQLAGDGAVLAISDRYRPDDFPPEIEVLGLGEPLDNVAITHATRERAEQRASGGSAERLFVSVTSFARAPVRREMRILTGDAIGAELVPTRTLDLAPGARAELAFDLPPGTPTIEVRLTEDALAIDDHAFLAPRQRRTVAIATTLDSERARELFLVGRRQGGSEALLGRWLDLVDETIEVDDPNAAHIVLGDAPAGGAATWSCVLARGGSSRQDFIGPFLIERRHPLLEGITLEGIVWSADSALAANGIPLVSAGNLPILLEDRQALKRTYTFNLEPSRSSLQRSPDWPILLANLVEERRRELPGPSRTNLVVGDGFEYRSTLEANAKDQQPFVLNGPTHRREHAPRPIVSFHDLDQPGPWSLTRNGAVLAQLAVSFQDPAESDLGGLGSGHREADLELARSAPASSWIESALIAAILAALLIDWFALSRGSVRVQSGSPSTRARTDRPNLVRT